MFCAFVKINSLMKGTLSESAKISFWKIKNILNLMIWSILPCVLISVLENPIFPGLWRFMFMKVPWEDGKVWKWPGDDKIPRSPSPLTPPYIYIQVDLHKTTPYTPASSFLYHQNILRHSRTFLYPLIIRYLSIKLLSVFKQSFIYP